MKERNFATVILLSICLSLFAWNSDDNLTWQWIPYRSGEHTGFVNPAKNHVILVDKVRVPSTIIQDDMFVVRLNGGCYILKLDEDAKTFSPLVNAPLLLFTTRTSMRFPSRVFPRTSAWT